jgi:hypothetical protein
VGADDKTDRQQNRILTIDKRRFTVRRARLASAMISTPGQRASRRRQRGALPAWSCHRSYDRGVILIGSERLPACYQRYLRVERRVSRPRDTTSFRSTNVARIAATFN